MISLLTGQSEEHLVEVTPFKIRLHREVAQPFEQLREAAAPAGFDLRAASGFRSFERQKQIWNKRALANSLLGPDGKTQEATLLSEKERVKMILHWLMIPGGSRHHWGTDLDVYCANLKPSPDYVVQLTPDESLTIFGKLHSWLEANIESFGFYRPYREYRGGVRPELWHLSYRPLAENFLSSFKQTDLERVLFKEHIELKSSVLELLPEIWEKYIINIGV